MRIWFRYLVIVVSLTTLLPISCSALSDLKTDASDNRISLQLRWTPQFQFIGYYAALWQGYYQDAGLDVEIIPGSPTRQPHREVLSGRAQYGVGNSEVLLSYLQDKPLIALAAILQHSPSVLLTRKDSNIRTPQDLIGKRVMMLGGSNDVEFFAMLASEGVSPTDVTIMPSSYRVEDLLEGKVDVFNAYLSNEPFYLASKGVEPFVINPVDYGVDMYSDILFTSNDELKHHPQRVKAFLQASLKGWRYALQHQDEMINRLLEMNIGKTREQLQNEAKVLQRLIQPNTISLGNINPGRFERMADLLQKFGFVQHTKSVEDFIYDPNPKVRQSTFLKVLALAMTGLLVVIFIAFWFWNTSRRLQHEIALRKETERSLQSSQRHFQQIVETLQEVYFRTDTRGNIVYISPSVENLLKQSVDKIIGNNIENYYVAPYKFKSLLEALHNENGKIKDYEQQVLTADNREIWVAINSQFFYEGDKIIGVEGTAREITQQKDQEELMKSMAFEDPLTGLYNRRSLIKQLNIVIKQSIEQNQFGALLFMDLDNFKPVNDEFGHNTGDELLKIVACRLRQSVRKGDVVFRIGGDEFVILLSSLNTADSSAAEIRASKIASTLIVHLRELYLVDHLSLHLSASIGIKLFPDEMHDADHIIEQADKGMYTAKDRGKDQYYIV
ncbi:ABC transporter substrate-binding protein [Thiomicrorhabdus sp. 6S2-11]|uniref:ABC transporter substrate-binding protein n=1 Tax=Thiomicrorhabdus marina TaxID=2818442 RepID=A0ABS3Q762_9GAMM|nr:ABC transporter substrate-binding protein [Thiomicrorhabdus marina]MBO1928169.1 ABC transporter substrate-binding protein [Thiomicrorhabdus marina]